MRHGDWVHTSNYGRHFGEPSKDGLSDIGKRIINTFINQNEITNEQRKEDELIYQKYRLSRPPVQVNPWKFALHSKGEFEKVEYDQIVSFKQEIPKDFLITAKFKVPKKEGGYFSEII